MAELVYVPQTGLRGVSADRVAALEESVNRMVAALTGDSSDAPITISGGATFGGNVGIGTASPGSALHVAGQITAGATTTITSSNGRIEVAGATGEFSLQDRDSGATWSSSDRWVIYHQADILRFFRGSDLTTIDAAGNVVIAGTLTVNGNQSGAVDHVFDSYDDMELLHKWRAGEPLPFAVGDLLNRDRLLRDTIIGLEARIRNLEVSHD